VGLPLGYKERGCFKKIEERISNGKLMPRRVIHIYENFCVGEEHPIVDGHR